MQTALAENKKKDVVQNRANTSNDSVNGRTMPAMPVLQKNEEKITATPEQDLSEKSGLSALLRHAANTIPGNSPANHGEEDNEHKGYFAFNPKKVTPEKSSGLSSFFNSVKTNSKKEPGTTHEHEAEGENKGYFAFNPQNAVPEKSSGLSSFFNSVKANSEKEPEEKKEHETEGENKGWFGKSAAAAQKPAAPAGSFFKNLLHMAAPENEETKEEEGKEEPLAGAENDTQNMTGAGIENEQQVAFVPTQGSNAEQNGISDPAKEGSPKVTVDFFNSGASVMARGIDQFSNRISTGFQNDAEQLTATTPVVQTGLKTDAINDPVKPDLPEEEVANAVKPWLPPAPALRTDTPKFQPTAGANPQDVETEAAAKSAQVTAGGNQINANIVKMPGEELVQGQEIHPSAQVELTASKTIVPAGSFPEMEEYMNIEMADGFRQEVDAASAGMYSETLAEPRNQVENAKAKRDQDQAGAISDANQKADELGKKASDEQAQTINESRSLIGAEKEKSLEESKATLAEYDGKVSAEKQSKLDEINTQIAAHETKANSELNNADKKVAAEQKKANDQKAEEQRKAEEKKRNRKWWQKIGDFFSDIANALASVVSSIVKVLASVVKTIVSVAKTLANTIINTCTSLVKKLLNTFASIVKGFLTIALAAFPGIRDRLNAFIDKTVSKVNDAIDKVAKGLTDAIDTLCDTLTKIIDSAQTFLVAVVQGAVMLFNALITGNFADMPRIAFMTACNSLGLPGEELWAIVQKASGEAMEIVKHPASFLGNLIKAGEKGFGQFLSNIKQSLMTGLMGWLFGQIGQSGVTVPEKFDGASIFLVVRQVLGVTYEHVRERAVGIMGEKNVERAEAVLNYLKRLFTEGPEVLFEEMKGKAEEMKSSFVSQIEEWAINTVIQKAVIKVSSMLVPGSGFVQSIYGMWQTIQFFLDNIKKIAAVVNSLLDSLADISRGAIGNAANLVEKTMTDTLPLVFAWLAKLIGIDGVGQKVKGIVDKLRTPVNTAVDFVINGAIKLGTSAVNAVKSGAKGVKDKVTGWWKKRTPIKTKSGETHTFYFEGDEKNLKPMVASTPTELIPLLQKWIKVAEGRNDSNSIQKINFLYDRAKKMTDAKSNAEMEGEEVNYYIFELANIFSEFGGNDLYKADTPSSMGDGHDEENETDVAGKPTLLVDVTASEVDKATLYYIFMNVAISRNKALSSELDNDRTKEIFEKWYGLGVLTQAGFDNLFKDPPAQKKPIQFARTPGTISFQPGYNSSGVGPFVNVYYQLDKKGSIEFNTVKKFTTWTNPVNNEPKVQLNSGMTNISRGLMRNGYDIPLADASRSQHFAIANRLTNRQGSSSPNGLTWHHLTTKYEMHLVDRMVHSKHGHNGGFLLWK